LAEETVISQHTRKKTALGVYSLKVPEPNLGRAKKQVELLERIDMSSGPVLVRELTEEGYSNAMVNTLYKKGLIDKVDVGVERDPSCGRSCESYRPQGLTGEQQHPYH